MGLMKGYARPELLADPDWLWEHRDDPNVRLVDCGPSDAYERAHIAGAVRIVGHPWLKTEPDPYSHLNEPLHVIGPEDFASAMGEIGISNDTTVVAYDSLAHQFATRLWWVLAYYGHRCQAGIATTLDIFAVTLFGWDRVRCYDAAMGEWANRDDTPLVVGEATPASAS